MYVLSKDEGGGEDPFTNETQLMMYSKTWNITASVTIASEGKEMVMPGTIARERGLMVVPFRLWFGYRLIFLRC